MARGVSIVARRLEKSFEGGLVRALAGVDLDIAPGERVAITGPTGSGKSTLLALVALLERPSSGELQLDGVPGERIRSPERWRASNLGLVFQLHHLVGHLTVEENVRVAQVAAGGGRAGRERVGEILGGLGLAPRRRTLASGLSGGERQLVALARALVNRPRLVLADEPTGSVDSSTGERLLTMLLDHCRESAATLVLVTHDEGLAARLDRTVAMRDGRVVAIPCGAA